MKQERPSKCGFVLMYILALLFTGAIVFCGHLYAGSKAGIAMCGCLFAGVLVLAWAAIVLQREYIKAYFDYRRSCENAKTEEYKFSQRLIELISSHAKQCNVAASNNVVALKADASSISLSAEIHLS